MYDIMAGLGYLAGDDLLLLESGAARARTRLKSQSSRGGGAIGDVRRPLAGYLQPFE